MKNRVFPSRSDRVRAEQRAGGSTAGASEGPAPPSEMLHTVSDLMRRYPLATLVTGGCLGVALGWWVKRR